MIAIEFILWLLQTFGCCQVTYNECQYYLDDYGNVRVVCVPPTVDCECGEVKP